MRRYKLYDVMSRTKTLFNKQGKTTFCRYYYFIITPNMCIRFESERMELDHAGAPTNENHQAFCTLMTQDEDGKWKKRSVRNIGTFTCLIEFAELVLQYIAKK